MKEESVKVGEISSIEMEELMSRIKNYKKEYGAIYDEFMKSFKDEGASFEELVDQFEWQTYWLELRRRLQQTGMMKVKASRLEEHAPIYPTEDIILLEAVMGNVEEPLILGVDAPKLRS